MTSTNHPQAAAQSSANSARHDVAPKYSQARPVQLSLTLSRILEQIGRSLKVLAHLFTHTVAVFDDAPATAPLLTPSKPEGQIDQHMLKVCEHLDSDSEARLSKLETKASGLLSLVALVIPLTASALVYIRQHTMHVAAARLSLVLDIIAVLFFLLALIAALRALAVRGHDALFISAVVDPVTDKVRTYNTDFFGRGLLHVAAARQAQCDHIADFIRAAQVFLGTGVALAALAAATVLFQVREDTQTISGTVFLDGGSLALLQRGLDAPMARTSKRLDELDAQIQALQRMQSDVHTQAEIERLRQDIEQLKKAAAPTPVKARKPMAQSH